MTLNPWYKLQHKNYGFQNETDDEWQLQIQDIELMTQMTTSFLEHMTITFQEVITNNIFRNHDQNWTYGLNHT
jgi:hypothetical protein